VSHHRPDTTMEIIPRDPAPPPSPDGAPRPSASPACRAGPVARTRGCRSFPSDSPAARGRRSSASIFPSLHEVCLPLASSYERRTDGTDDWCREPRPQRRSGRDERERSIGEPGRPGRSPARRARPGRSGAGAARAGPPGEGGSRGTGIAGITGSRERSPACRPRTTPGETTDGTVPHRKHPPALPARNESRLRPL
jgi:hypothetical protein